jgi:class 3 adenylate cyclase
MHLVRYDSRGFGLSTRDLSGFSIETCITDLETIVEALGLEKFVVLGIASAGPPAIRYAAQHPDRVEALILQDTAARMRDVWRSRVRSMHPMLTAATDIYFRTIADLAYGHGTEDAALYAQLLMNSTNPRVGRLAMESAFQFDASEDVPNVKCPTLAVHGLKPLLPAEALTSLAAGIPGAELAMLALNDGRLLYPQLWQEVSRFLLAHGLLRGVAASGRAETLSALRTVLFTDLVGHTEMMSRLGDEAGRAVLREHEDITRNVLKQNGGTEVKTMGDGFMASFGSVTKAVECAVALQRAFAEREGEPLSVRVGLNAGEPIEEDGDLFGATVILASRIAAKADAGEILVADTVRGLCSGKGFLFADRGEFVAKGFEEPVRVYEVSWRP